MSVYELSLEEMGITHELAELQLKQFKEFLQNEFERSDSIRTHEGTYDDSRSDSIPSGFSAETALTRIENLADIFSELIDELHFLKTGELSVVSLFKRDKNSPKRDPKIVAAEALRVFLEAEFIAAKTSGSNGKQLQMGSLSSLFTSAAGVTILWALPGSESFILTGLKILGTGAIMGLQLVKLIWNLGIKKGKPWGEGNSSPRGYRKHNKKNAANRLRLAFWNQVLQLSYSVLFLDYEIVKELGN